MSDELHQHRQFHLPKKKSVKHTFQHPSACTPPPHKHKSHKPVTNPPVWWWFRTSKWIDPHPPRPRCYHKAHPGRYRRPGVRFWLEVKREKKRGRDPQGQQKKRDREIWRHPTWQVIFFVFFVASFWWWIKRQLLQIQSWNIKKKKAPESARWYDPSSARCAGCSSRASLPCFLRLVKEYYSSSQPIRSWPSLRNGLSTWESGWIFTNHQLALNEIVTWKQHLS